MPDKPTRDESAVFLNVPFDRGYQPLFIALIAALTSLGRKPRCTLEIPEHGQGRIIRIIELLDNCAVSIHDLSRVGVPVRFNMPFELGLAVYAKMKHTSSNPSQKLMLLEKVPHRLSKTFSDVEIKPSIHAGKPLDAIFCVLDSLGREDSDSPSIKDVYLLWKKLMINSRNLMDNADRPDVYSRMLFKQLVAASTDLAVEKKFIQP